MISRVDSWISHVFTLYLIFKNFHDNSHYRIGHFQENREIHI